MFSNYKWLIMRKYLFLTRPHYKFPNFLIDQALIKFDKNLIGVSPGKILWHEGQRGHLSCHIGILVSYVRMLYGIQVVSNLKSCNFALLKAVEWDFTEKILPLRFFLQLKIIVEDVDVGARANLSVLLVKVKFEIC